MKKIKLGFNAVIRTAMQLLVFVALLIIGDLLPKQVGVIMLLVAIAAAIYFNYLKLKGRELRKEGEELDRKMMKLCTEIEKEQASHVLTDKIERTR